MQDNKRQSVHGTIETPSGATFKNSAAELVGDECPLKTPHPSTHMLRFAMVPGNSPIVILFMLLLLLITTPARAHNMKVFAAVDGDRITGRVYFAGGGTAGQGMQIRVEQPNKTSLGTTTTDAEGRFTFTPIRAVDHVFIANAAGHRAEYTVHRDELSATLTNRGNGDGASPTPMDDERRTAGNAGTTDKAAPGETKPSPPSRHLRSRDDAVIPAAVAAEFKRLIREGVSAELKPMREELDAMKTATQWRDVFGSVGFIFGLAGIYFFLKTRLRQGKQA